MESPRNPPHLKYFLTTSLEMDTPIYILNMLFQLCILLEPGPRWLLSVRPCLNYVLTFRLIAVCPLDRRRMTRNDNVRLKDLCLEVT